MMTKSLEVFLGQPELHSWLFQRLKKTRPCEGRPDRTFSFLAAAAQMQADQSLEPGNKLCEVDRARTRAHRENFASMALPATQEEFLMLLPFDDRLEVVAISTPKITDGEVAGRDRPRKDSAGEIVFPD